MVPFLIEETSLRRALLAWVPGAPLGASRFDPDVGSLAANRRLDNLLAYRVIFLSAQVGNFGRLKAVLDNLVAALNQ